MRRWPSNNRQRRDQRSVRRSDRSERATAGVTAGSAGARHAGPVGPEQSPVGAPARGARCTVADGITTRHQSRPWRVDDTGKGMTHKPCWPRHPGPEPCRSGAAGGLGNSDEHRQILGRLLDRGSWSDHGDPRTGRRRSQRSAMWPGASLPTSWNGHLGRKQIHLPPKPHARTNLQETTRQRQPHQTPPATPLPATPLARFPGVTSTTSGSHDIRPRSQRREGVVRRDDRGSQGVTRGRGPTAGPDVEVLGKSAPPTWDTPGPSGGTTISEMAPVFGGESVKPEEKSVSGAHDYRHRPQKRTRLG